MYGGSLKSNERLYVNTEFKGLLEKYSWIVVYSTKWRESDTFAKSVWNNIISIIPSTNSSDKSGWTSEKTKIGETVSPNTEKN